MCHPAVMIAVTAASTLMSMKAQSDQASTSAGIARNNATMAEYAAADAQRKGEQDAAAVQRKAASLKSSQRVGAAAHGLDVGYGTAGDLQDQTDFFAQEDVNTVRNNAAKDAWGYRAQGQSYQTQARATEHNGQMAVMGTFLGGAGQVADKWYTHYGKK
jgi:hypothetical protein